MATPRCSGLARWLTALAGAAALVSAAVAQGQGAGAPVEVRTASGAVAGHDVDGVAVFRGIPYAAPPTGALRWRPPQPPAPWPETRSADAFGKACPQRRDKSIDQAGDPGPVDEDCLFLNVWTPGPDPTARRPVMVWIHGGAFVIGSGSQSLYDGGALARRGAVVVTFNYRLGALGFFAHPALDRAAPNGPVNFGLFDQIAVLRWVKDNIAVFGGDPGNVTLFGESAGAQSVLALFTSPLARTLFHRGIAQSAYGIPSHSRAKAREVGVAVAKAVGLAGAQATAAQLRDVPSETLAGLEGPGLSLAPGLVVGDAALPEPILAAFQSGKEAPLPLVLGNNSDEASVAVAFGVDPAALIRRLGAARVAVKPLYPDVADDAQLGREVVRDVVFGAYARRLAYLHSARSATWRYYFSRVPDGAIGRQPGVPHGGEIADIFGVDDGCGCLPAPRTEADRAASQGIGDRWVAFARDGDPNAGTQPAWPRDSRARWNVLEFGAAPAVRVDFMKRRLNTFIGALNVLGFFAERGSTP